MSSIYCQTTAKRPAQEFHRRFAVILIVFANVASGPQRPEHGEALHVVS